MAKDPALLWYFGDWYSGTSLMTRFIKGCYMDLLHAQFNNGHLSLEEIKTCLGSDFGSSWPTLQKKFQKDEQGLFFNERLDFEKTKRVNFCSSRRKNLSSDMAHHMENENGTHALANKNESEILEIIRGVKSEYLKTQIKTYKITPKRIKLIANRQKDFNKLWPGRDFNKACQFAFRYKAKEWFGTQTFQYFEPETLLSEKFISYLEKAEQDKGEPYIGEPKKKEEEKVLYQIPK